MNVVGSLSLRNRTFQVAEARATKYGDLWALEFQALAEIHDGEWWSPRLYHQGLKIDAVDISQLSGQTITWGLSEGPEYPHPEIGMMYVFGHEPVRNCSLNFGQIVDKDIEFKWSGECDVFWDGEFIDNVPFSLICRMAIDPGAKE